MIQLPDELQQRLEKYQQSHVLAFWAQLTEQQQRSLLQQLASLDLDQLAQLYEQRNEGQAVPSADRIKPVPVLSHTPSDADERRRQGEAALKQGRVATLLVAGGQGSRLGFEHPKGMYPVGPVSRKPLFQIHAEKVLALSRRHGRALPFLIMTSPATHEETVAFFREQRYYGLPESAVHFFCQGTMPALDLATGRLLLEEPGQLFLGPDGHGGTLTALATSGLLARLKQQGIEQVFYFQVDNPLVKIADPLFIGQHLHARAEVSSKVVAKVGPKEKMGVLAQVDGRCCIVEYSDLPDELAHATDATGRLLLWAGNPAIHLFDVGFLERMTNNTEYLSFHIAKKKVPHVDATGKKVEPKTENALKFERFIFDVLPAAQRWAIVEALREEEFAPLKNADGADSPATVHTALVEQATRWIAQTGGSVALDANGKRIAVEISPLFALDAVEAATKLPSMHVNQPRYFE